MTVRVYVGLGSNLDREVRLRSAVCALRGRFGVVELSPVYDSAAVGFDGRNFLNLVAGFDCDLEPDALVAELHRIEDRLGRDRSRPKFSSRSIDLDLLLYGDCIVDLPGIRVPRPEILEYGFVLKPLQDLVPEQRHPQNGETYARIWQAMSASAPPLARYAMTFDD